MIKTCFMIYVHNEYDEIIETYNNVDHMYKVMKSRYAALQNKRHDDIKNAFNKGWMYGAMVTVAACVLLVFIFKLF